MPEEQQQPELDLSKIKFPFDRITIGEMRKLDDNLFNLHPPLRDVAAISIGALATSSFEHMFARKAFNRALGLPDPYPRTHRDDIAAMLASDYEQYGLSKGAHESAELVKRIESAAEEQARPHRRGAPGPQSSARG